VLKDVAGMELPPAAKKSIDAEGRIVKDGVGRPRTYTIAKVYKLDLETVELI
jgi:hypothetical protein